MTANENRPKRLKPTIILKPEREGAIHPPRPFYCCWYRIVFDRPARSGAIPTQPSTESRDTRH